MNDRSERAARANVLLKMIAENGVHFFKRGDDVCRFEIEIGGGVVYYCAMARERVKFNRGFNFKALSTNGQIRGRLLHQLSHFIRTDQRLTGDQLGPWTDEPNKWGYGDAMEAIRAKAIELDLVQPASD